MNDITDRHIIGCAATRSNYLPQHFMLISFDSDLSLEIVSESSIDEHKRCYTKTVQSVGLCAAPKKSGRANGCLSYSVLVSQFNWVDKVWDCVQEGKSILPSEQQVMVFENPKQKKRRFLAKHFNVSQQICSPPGWCGEVLVSYDSYALRVRNWTRYQRIPGKKSGKGMVAVDSALVVVNFSGKKLCFPCRTLAF